MSRRLPLGGRIQRDRSIAFRFNGRCYQGFAGDTLASALLAQGELLLARSWKYHRPRGILGAGVEEPNGLAQLYDGERTVPNARLTEVELVEGLSAKSVNASPSVRFDAKAVNSWFSRLIPAGFYYKTFMASQAAWHFFEKRIRAVSGLGVSPLQPDPDRYGKRFHHCDVLVIGAGVAGLCAALAAAQSGARVLLCDEQAEMGGWLLSSAEYVDALPAAQWAEEACQRLAAMPEVTLLPRTTAFGYHPHDFITLLERVSDHLPRGEASSIRERLWKVRAKQVVLASGAHERPLVFANNDLPGIMLASAIATYVRRYAVVPGQRAVIFTNNDAGYDAALALSDHARLITVVDARAATSGDLSVRARQAGIEILSGQVVTEARGRKKVKAVVVQPLGADEKLTGSPRVIACDLLGVSGGFSPVIHLHSQAGGKAVWDDRLAAFLPGSPAQSEQLAGACRGLQTLRDCALDGNRTGSAAARLAACMASSEAAPSILARMAGNIRPLWLVPHPKGVSRAPKQFVDFQNDVAASDIFLAVREGFESIEHVKRYTALGFGTDQGKTSNINGMGIAALALARPLREVGTTVFRPNYTPVSFGALAGSELGDAFEPIRTTAMHAWHVGHGAQFEDVGQWKRPWYYPHVGEDRDAAVRREVLAVRNKVGTLDASTLGKIEIQGPDASALLNMVYCNAWSKLEVGKCRYGLMLNEMGMVFDDGVTVRLGENHFLMHTTTGGAARVLAWLERWLQTEWTDLKVFLTTVTDQWATTTVAGPRSKDVLKLICSDVDFDDAAFPFMSYRPGTVAGLPARIMRISFSGERSYEINVEASAGLQVWESVHAAGARFDITPYGTEAMHVLRAEKGYIIVGQDTDGSVTPFDLGMHAMVAKNKDCLGKRSLSRSDMWRSDRKQLVGLLSDDPQFVLPEGAQILQQAAGPVPALMEGHITSSYSSPTLGRAIALALVKGGSRRMGERVQVALPSGRTVTAVITQPVFFDPQSERQNV